ncbi:MAG: hypothetical protein MN733_38520 [Nitrososphaera sp.]|nr:hypothetical protein [Nitrososphaera sp.]
MDARVRKAVLAKIDEAISHTSEVAEIRRSLGSVPVSSEDDFEFGISIGRIYNSFHYQTRRILKRNASEEEFAEFLQILAGYAGKIQDALSSEHQ